MKKQPRQPRRPSRVGRDDRLTPAQTSAPPLHPVQIWDLPTRLSHAALVVLLLVQILSGQFSLLPASVHLWVGYLLLLVVLFRIGWGLVGSESARFGAMLASLRGLPAYLPLLFSSRPTRWPGHNPVGALSSLVLLLLLLLSCLSGLFIETWAEDRGVLAERVSRQTGLWMADLHGLLRWPLYLLVSIHVLAALGYLLFKRENRITAIFASGRVGLEQPSRLQLASNRRALLVLALCAALLAAILILGPVA